MGNNETVGLEDICYQPLYPDNKNCVINSVLQYFQVCYYTLLTGVLLYSTYR